MSEIVINGGKRLNGSLRVQGSKNAVLPIMAAAVLCNGVTTLGNVPKITDVTDMIRILGELGCVSIWQGEHTLTIDATRAWPRNIAACLTEKMRSSIFLLGPLLARFGEANLHMPGGCHIGKRPIDLHLSGLRSLGAVIHEQEDGVAAISLGLVGNVIRLRYPSVGATENILMAAVAAGGHTCISGCAREPEIVELCLFLNSMGARISGIGSSELHIIGVPVKTFREVRFDIGGDRIAAATYLYAAGGCGGTVRVTGIRPVYLGEVLKNLRRMGFLLHIGEDFIEISAIHRPLPLEVVTGPYPAFPTDLQSITLAVLGRARGISLVTETVFEGRFLVTKELEKFGVRLKVCNRSVMIYGVERMKAAAVCAADLRGGAALVLAGLMAEGETVITGISHIDRGYEGIDGALAGLGADIRRR